MLWAIINVMYGWFIFSWISREAYKLHIAKWCFSPVLNVLKHEYSDLWHDVDYSKRQERLFIVEYLLCSLFLSSSVVILLCQKGNLPLHYMSDDLLMLEYPFLSFCQSMDAAVQLILW